MRRIFVVIHQGKVAGVIGLSEKGQRVESQFRTQEEEFELSATMAGINWSDPVHGRQELWLEGVAFHELPRPGDRELLPLLMELLDMEDALSPLFRGDP